MELNIFLSIIGMVIIFIGEIYYVRQILKKIVIPHPFSWLGWAIATIVISIAQFKNGGGIGSFILFSEAIGLFFIFLLSLKYGVKKFETADKIYISLALFSIILWHFTETALWSVLLITFADIFSFLPTFRKTFNKPFEEDIFIFLTAGVSYFISLFALSNLTIITSFYPIAIIILDFTFIIFIIFRRHLLKNKNK